ncbi:MAG: nitrogen regulation protein NR(II) [Alphaproteobacteria bacterium]|jgi:two-component system nitrogen regulation sensor histidine kinase GlnL|nr:nitrogen regulation protein NR(II) [Alphaproteobacteria bacterium]
MNAVQQPRRSAPAPAAVLYALATAVMVLDRDCRIELVNAAAEQLLGASAGFLTERDLSELIPEDSPLIALVRQVLAQGNSVAEYGLRLAGPKIGARYLDVEVAPLADDKGARVVVSLVERSMARRMDRQLSQGRTARSVAGMAAVLAHEIKNPLSGIRGAAQLLEHSVSDPDRELTQLICSETDRIRGLVDRMEVFSDDRPLQRDQVNIHDVLQQVHRLAVSGFARHVRFKEHYDPSLPSVFGNRDQLLQVFLNLVKNAAEAVPRRNGEIVLSTRFRHGIRISVSGSRDRLQLPIVVTVGDNGPGIPEDLRQVIFEPFVTTKANGTGLGLSLVAKIIEDHGGVVEVESKPRRTVFSMLLPVHPRIGGEAGAPS